tara:strand:- start:1038 stop:1850 length:813 start_codon:yes stop_codon:yes gene_type:complete
LKIWKNTSTLYGYDEGLTFTKNKSQAKIALLGSKPINLVEFPNLKGIFRAGIGRDNVPENEAIKRGIIVKYPSKKTTDIIYDETASFTCGLIFRMLYNEVGSIEPWIKYDRSAISEKNLLVIGCGNIGSRVVKHMESIIHVVTYDIIKNKPSELEALIRMADCITLHIPKISKNDCFMNSERLGMMKDGSVLINTARGTIVDEESLYKEIKSGRIKAAFDVFWKEPYSGKLTSLGSDQFFMTPHIASTCRQFILGCREGLDSLIMGLNHD